MADSRPIYLNLFKIRLPVTGILSFAHRITGALLFLSLPFLVWLLDQSLSGESAFQQVMHLLSLTLVKLGMLTLVWCLIHHLYAGIRFLLIDLDIGVSKSASTRSAWLVLALELLTMIALGIVWLQP